MKTNSSLVIAVIEEILFVWSGLTLVLLGILYQVWSA
jgi:hypothetical protein